MPVIAIPDLTLVTSADNGTVGSTSLNDHEIWLLKMMAIYSAILIVLWNFPLLKYLLLPCKLFNTSIHEVAGHGMAAVLTGGKIKSITIEANTAGATVIQGGNQYVTLPAGYIGTAFYGGIMLFCAFNVLASKIVSIVIGVFLLIMLYYAKGWIARLISVFYIGLIVMFWLIQDAYYLTFFILFLGTLCCLNSLLDFESLIFSQSIEDSDPYKFSKLCKCLPAQGWAFLWLIISLIFMAGFTFLGIFVF
ncbi:hypothetical protein MIR68_002901 [Amoeboaphelidium protococcarum]|nr:hypothetical protein MIR68_002901 [Amoeboaphelidium protococcarum]KAI3647852.1 hypothetical protein MP228_008073 [Amoeboaphelidium protococcarum]KAI3653553.1 hypothetical protein MP228_001500 [Amoeboaphelidium protococcarum]